MKREVVLANQTTAAGSTNGAAVTIPDVDAGWLFIKWANVAGTTPTLDVKIQWQDPFTGTWIDMKDAAQAQVVQFAQKTTSNGTDYMYVHPALAAAAANKAFNVTVPRVVRVVATVGGTATPTYTWQVVFHGIKS
jgi:hypothetical protein